MHVCTFQSWSTTLCIFSVLVLRRQKPGTPRWQTNETIGMRLTDKRHYWLPLN